MNNTVPIFHGANNEKACRAVMGNLRFKGECLQALHEKVNKSLELIEAIILKCPNDDNKTLLLQTLELYKRKKCVATYDEPVVKMTYDENDNETPVLDKDGKPVYETDRKGKIKYTKCKYEMAITVSAFQVSITASKVVRVHMKDTVAATLAESLKGVVNLKIY
jgi:hypothetical protein